MKIIFICNLLVSLSAFANPKIITIYDGEFDMDGPACWLLNSNSEVVLYDDLKTARIKIDSKIISLNRSSGKFEPTFFSCGNKYKYESDDKSTSVSIKMNSPKIKTCTGTMIVKTPIGKTTVNQLKSECGN